MEGRCCPLGTSGATAVTARRARCRLSTACSVLPDGCPVAIEVFDGNTADPMTLATQIEKLKRRFQLNHVVLVGDRGMITQGAHHRGHQIGRPGLDLLACAHQRDQGAGGKQCTCSSRCSTSATWPLSPCPNSPMSASWSAATPISPPSSMPRKREELLAATERDPHPHPARRGTQARSAARHRGRDCARGRQGDQQT